MKTPPIHPDPFNEAIKKETKDSEFSQNPQEFREKGAVSPFATMSASVRQI